MRNQSLDGLLVGQVAGRDKGPLAQFRRQGVERLLTGAG